MVFLGKSLSLPGGTQRGLGLFRINPGKGRKKGISRLGQGLEGDQAGN
jgi:hypothetical protein